MSLSAQRFDVMILGAGPAGATASAVLADAGVRVLMVDHAQTRRVHVGEGLPPGARPLLRQLGMWDELSVAHLPSRGNESAWGSPRLHSTQFVRDPAGQGWHLDRPRFDASLRHAAALSGACLQYAKVVHVARNRSGWQLTLDLPHRRVVHASWTIDCTGRRAWFARRGGASRRLHDRLVAFVSQCAVTPGDRDAMTLVESAPHGWWYTSRLPAGKRVVAYLTDGDDVSARHGRSAAGFSAMLRATLHIEGRMGSVRIDPSAAPRIVAADSSRLERPAGLGWLAAGDAAMSFDPLSSQGVLTAMYSGMIAAQTVRSHLSGDRSAIANYCERLDAIYSTYLHHRRDYYAQERRWSHHAFWHRRHATS